MSPDWPPGQCSHRALRAHLYRYLKIRRTITSIVTVYLARGFDRARKKPRQAIDGSESLPSVVKSRSVAQERLLLAGPVAPIPLAVAVSMLAPDLQLRTSERRFTVAVVVAGVRNRASGSIETGRDLWSPIQGGIISSAGEGRKTALADRSRGRGDLRALSVLFSRWRGGLWQTGRSPRDRRSIPTCPRFPVQVALSWVGSPAPAGAH
jgi:hypothetical protein